MTNSCQKHCVCVYYICMYAIVSCFSCVCAFMFDGLSVSVCLSCDTVQGLVPVQINPRALPRLYENAMVVGYPMVG